MTGAARSVAFRDAVACYLSTGNFPVHLQDVNVMGTATGEEVPRGRSIRARLLILNVRPGEVDRPTLSECQRAGHEGRLAASMAAFLGWIAENYEEVHRRLQTRELEIRSQGNGRAVHARIPSALAELQTGWEIFLKFAFEAAVIGKRERQDLEERSQRAFDQLCALQAKYQEASDPASRFVALLRAALACGRAHVRDRLGKSVQINNDQHVMCDHHNGTRFGPRRFTGCWNRASNTGSILACDWRTTRTVHRGSQIRVAMRRVAAFRMPAPSRFAKVAGLQPVQCLGRIEKSRAARKHATIAMAVAVRKRVTIGPCNRYLSC